MRNMQHIIEDLHDHGFSDEFIAKAVNWLTQQPEALRKALKNPVQYIVDNEYLINHSEQMLESSKEKVL